MTHNPEFTTCEFYWAYQVGLTVCARAFCDGALLLISLSI